MDRFRMKFCNFKNPSTEKILRGDWTPFKPSYHPFVDVHEFCIPCYRWRFLKLIRGNWPIWRNLLRNPNDSSEEFTNYSAFSSRFREYATFFIRRLSRSVHPRSILNIMNNPALLLDSIQNNSSIDDLDLQAMNLVSNWLERLNNENILSNYVSSENSLFNLYILNEKLDLFINDTSPIIMTEQGQTIIGEDQSISPNQYSWRRTIPIFGTIPILNLERREIRVPVPIANNFFFPNLDLLNPDTPEGIRLFFINFEFHKMWILRESLAQLIENNKMPLTVDDDFGNFIFRSNTDLTSIEVREFQIILDTIDNSIMMPSELSFRNETGQAAIISYILYSNYPGKANSFQGFDPCPIRIGQVQELNYGCPFDGNRGCGMSDRRIRNLQFPRDRMERNTYRFLRHLRDESVFEHNLLYKITRLYPNRLFDLNQFAKFWIGEFYLDDQERYIFNPTMPNFWSLPEINETYELSLISPICYESGFKINVNSIEDDFYILIPSGKLNPWFLESPFNSATTDNPLSCIIGKFSVSENLMNIQRQKRQLTRAIQYSRNAINTDDLTDMQNTVLTNRLNERYKRIAMATFGRFARYV